ncbi:hypothetical protein V6N11_064864 [Hibiscus sabdariffa]|uniref:Uncharacterized protein n=2 Tax=Hibiscus sabdariffa TaxID=183260 RepID=A0ABR2SI82_9ROSI
MFTGHLQIRKKGEFFSELTTLVRSLMVPICIGGDFNSFHVPEEKVGFSISMQSVQIFCNFVSDCELIDMPMLGGAFTWSNNREFSTFVRNNLLSPTSKGRYDGIGGLLKGLKLAIQE